MPHIIVDAMDVLKVNAAINVACQWMRLFLHFHLYAPPVHRTDLKLNSRAFRVNVDMIHVCVVSTVVGIIRAMEQHEDVQARLKIVQCVIQNI